MMHKNYHSKLRPRKSTPEKQNRNGAPTTLFDTPPHPHIAKTSSNQTNKQTNKNKTDQTQPNKTKQNRTKQINTTQHETKRNATKQPRQNDTN